MGRREFGYREQRVNLRTLKVARGARATVSGD